MKSIHLELMIKRSFSYTIGLVIMGLMLGCSSAKRIKQEKILSGSDQNTKEIRSRNHKLASTTHDYIFDNHGYISLDNRLTIPSRVKSEDSLLQMDQSKEVVEYVSPAILDSSSPVAYKIVENYHKSENKEPNGHCLDVSRGRFEEAYKEIYGHMFYKDLPDSMASKFNTPRQVFDLLYVSASDTQRGWRSLPEKYRGKGNAGAIAYAGMGTLADTHGVWSGELRPGALMQVWRFKEDYEKVVRGVNVKKLDPYGHSFIFINYVRNEENEIIGLKIADQGFQSYRPLIPSDYEVWWAVNLSI